MKIRINKIIYTYLKNNILEANREMERRIKATDINGYMDIEITDNDADKIRDLALDKLQIIGYDINYNLTKEGEILEEIIDVLYQ